MRKVSVLFFGLGFLFSHTLPSIVPYLRRAVLVDREFVEPANYDNAFIPKGFVNRRKTSAALALLSLFSDAEAVVYHKEVATPEDLLGIAREHGVDLVYATVDNIPARKVARAVAGEVPVLMAGVTEGFGYVDWADRATVPEETEEIRRSIERVRDACTRIEFRPLGAVIGALAGTAIVTWVSNGRRVGYYVWERGGVFYVHQVGV